MMDHGQRSRSGLVALHNILECLSQQLVLSHGLSILLDVLQATLQIVDPAEETISTRTSHPPGRIKDFMSLTRS